MNKITIDPNGDFLIRVVEIPRDAHGSPISEQTALFRVRLSKIMECCKLAERINAHLDLLDHLVLWDENSEAIKVVVQANLLSSACGGNSASD